MKMTKKDMMHWFKSHRKGSGTTMVLQEFEERYACLLLLNRSILDMSKVLLFLKAMVARDREKMGLLLENEGELTTCWVAVKGCVVSSISDNNAMIGNHHVAKV